jgi:hypothetical protein
MRKLARRLFALCAALSLLVCISVGVLWVDGYRTVTMYRWVTRDGRDLHERSVLNYNGLLAFRDSAHLLDDDEPGRKYGDYVVRRAQRPDRRGLEREPWDGAWPPLRNALLPSVVSSSAGRGPFYAISSSTVAVPAWMPLLATAILPALWIHAWRRQRRTARLGLCPACGYDLRATPGRCPECGSAAGTVTP